MDPAFANALKRKEKLERELAEIECFLRLYNRFAKTDREQTEPQESESLEVDIGDSGARRPRRRAKPTEIADMAERVIRDANAPMQRGELVAALEERGVSLPSQDKPRYIGTILWREKERFVNLAGRGYVMADMADAIDRDGDQMGRSMFDQETDN